jgi:hypothetical protein
MTDEKIPKLEDGTPISHKWVLIHCSAQGGRMGPDSNHFVALIEELSRAEAQLSTLQQRHEGAVKALRQMHALFAEPSPFYIRKLGSPINGGEE